jgi:arabinogalactan oligomer/maltooligosaccharide transport system substrate-binding protein
MCGGLASCGFNPFNSNIESSSEVDTNSKQYQIYQLAKSSGYSGTYEEWLNSIKGDMGRGIQSIDLTSTSGRVDTYTVTFTDGTTSTFTITNGKDGTSNGTGPSYDSDVPIGLDLSYVNGLGYFVDGYYGDSDTLVIPNTYNGEKIVGIKNRAFYRCDKLKSITLGDNISIVGNEGFFGIIGLEELIIPNRVITYGTYALDSESSGDEFIIKFNGTMDDWQKLSFNTINQNPLTGRGFPLMMKENGQYVYPTTINIPSSMTSIGNYQYTGLGTINKIYLHPNITSIGEYAFSGLKYNGVEIHFSGSENQWNSFAYKDLFTDIASEIIYNSEGSGTNTEKKIFKIGVSSEFVNTYTALLDEYILKNPSVNFDCEIMSYEPGIPADNMIMDPEIAPDIAIVPRDQLNKLIDANIIYSLTESTLVNQLDSNNPTIFKNVAKVGGEYYGSPITSQSLMLIYDKSRVTDEQAKTFEGLKSAASNCGKDVKGVVFSSLDGFNFSGFPLARKLSDKSTSVRLYEGGDINACYFQGEDTLQVTKWAQSYFADKNGAMTSTDAGWQSDIMSVKALAMIGGYWNLNDFADAVGGSSNVGVTILPSFNANGTEYRPGSFYDCKMLVINKCTVKESYKAQAEQIVKYLSSVECQNRLLKETGTVPSYVGASNYVNQIKNELSDIQYQSIMAQLNMSEWGIAQPFSNSILNTYYYSRRAPELYYSVISNFDDRYSTDNEIRRALYTIEHIWQKGQEPAAADIPASLPQDVQ